MIPSSTPSQLRQMTHRLAELHRAAHEKFRGQQRLPHPAPPHTSVGARNRRRDFVETLNARGTLGQLIFGGGGFVIVIFHARATFH